MLDEKTQKKYLRILNKGNTLKLDASDAIALLDKYRDEIDYDDQSGVHITESSLSKCNGKVILKFFTLWYMDNKKVMYWCPCSLNDLITVAGASNYNSESDCYDTFEHIPRAKQISFLGSDIKKACSSFQHNKQLDTFAGIYATGEHPIADNVFYKVYGKNIDTVQEFKCARDIVLSPRPEKKIDNAK